MRISRLHIENFRSIQSLDMPLPQLCALVGANSAGKSNLLEAIRRVLASDWGPRARDFSEDDVYLRDAERDITIECVFEPAISYAKLKDAKPVEIETLRFVYDRRKRGPDKGERRLNQSCHGKEGKIGSVQTSYPKKGTPPKFEPIVGIPQDVRDQVPLIHIGANRLLRDQLPSARFSLLRRIFENISTNFQRSTEARDFVDANGELFRTTPPEAFAYFLSEAMELLRTDEFEELEAAIKRNALEQLGLDADTDAIDLYFTPPSALDFYKTLDLMVREGQFAISATEVGGGVQNAIVLSILRAFEETRRSGAILLIEEPEMYLHPQMQRSLYRTLWRISETNQVIYTTHSPHFVSVPEYQNVYLVRRGGDGTRVTRSSLADDARLREKLVKELDPERNELFFASRLLLVEGDTEKLAFPAYAEKLALDLDRAGATIVEVGGKRSLKTFADIAISFGIPTGIVYDKDSKAFKDKRQDERAYNASLDALQTTDGNVQVWCLLESFEGEVRKTLGEQEYQRLCQAFPDYGKPTRARLIALEEAVTTPELFAQILTWLAGTEPAETTQEASAPNDDPELPF